jgi:predicted DNA-binding transcriptional regulator YafY
MEKQAVKILYKNYRGEVSYRTIVPKSIDFTATEWHTEEQWILTAFDIDKDADRGFAIADIKEWKNIFE